MKVSNKEEPRNGNIFSISNLNSKDGWKSIRKIIYYLNFTPLTLEFSYGEEILGIQFTSYVSVSTAELVSLFPPSADVSESTTIIKFECGGEKKSDAVGRARVEGRERTSEALGQAVAWGV